MTIRFHTLGILGLLAVAAVNLGLLGIFATIVVPNDASVDEAKWSPKFASLVEQPHSREPIEAFKEKILAKPIFFKTREPFVAPARLPPLKAPLAIVVHPDFVVAGVVIKSDAKMAYLLKRGSSSGRWTSVGDEFMGWTVRAVHATRVQLEQHGQMVEVSLYPEMNEPSK